MNFVKNSNKFTGKRSGNVIDSNQDLSMNLCNSAGDSNGVEIQIETIDMQDVNLFFNGIAEVQVYRREQDGTLRPFNANGIKAVLSHVIDYWSKYDYVEKTDHI